MLDGGVCYKGVATFQDSRLFNNPVWTLGFGFFLAAFLPGIPLIFGAEYSTDNGYVYTFAGALILDVVLLIACSIPWRERSRRMYPGARLGLIIGVLLGLAMVSTIAYIRFIRPVEIESIAGRVTEVRGKVVPVVCVVSSAGREANKATYMLQGSSGKIFVVAREGESSPQIGHRVWVLGWVGIDSVGDNFLFEHARRDLQ